MSVRREPDGAMWQQAGDVAGSNIQIGFAAGSVTVVVEDRNSSYRLDLLAPVPGRCRVPRSQQSPSHLLDVRRSVVPYRDRPAAQAALSAWRDDDEPVSVCLLHGPGGSGKTRLAARFATLAYAAGWQVVEARDLTAPGQGTVAGRADLRKSGDLLVLVDYAERWPLESLTTMIAALTGEFGAGAADGGEPAGRLRVLLLARPLEGFWKDVQAALGGLPVDLAEPIALQRFTDTAEDVRQAFDQAVHAFQPLVGTTIGPVPMPSGLASPELGRPGEVERSPLAIHMAALAAVCAVEAGEPVPGSDDLSQHLLMHERRYWQRLEPDSAVLARVVLLACLFGPADAEDARALLVEARVADSPASADRLLAAHARLYPEPLTGWTAPARLLPPLKPDRFAEDFIADSLAESFQGRFLRELLTADQAAAAAARRAFMVLAAAAGRHATVRTFLLQLLATATIRPSWLSPNLVHTVIEHAPHAVAGRLEDAIPVHRTDLLRAARDLSRHLYDTLPATTPDRRAYYLNRFGVRLFQAGDKRAALASLREAAEILLGSAKTGSVVDRLELAMSLNNLGINLWEVGDRRGALQPMREAVGILRKLAADENDNEHGPASHLPALASALDNLGVSLSLVGDKWGALESTWEAVEILQGMTEAECPHPAFARSLTNLGVRFSEVGDRRGALEYTRKATDVYRRLAGAEPELYLPDLAKSLANLGIWFSEVGDRRAALERSREAVDIFRELVEAEPTAYLSDLAMALTNLGPRFSELGDRRAALAPLREAVEIFRGLAESEPDRHLPDLATSLNNLGKCLWENGDRRAALERSREALEIRRRLVEVDRDVHLPGLAKSLNQLGVGLSGVGDGRAAVESVREATDIYRGLAEVEPAVHLSDLARSLTDLGVRFAEVGDGPAAVESVREATDIYRRLAGAERDRYLPALARTLWAGAWVRNSSGIDTPVALDLINEAIAIFATLAAQFPDVFDGPLTVARQTRAELLDAHRNDR